MYLDKLLIKEAGQDSTFIRQVEFKKGLNLIVDKTSTNNPESDSGNNVGKTTFIRSIDFCLGSDGAAIYKDKELNNDNEKVEKFLLSKNIIFELTIIDKNSKKHVLSRCLNSEYDLLIDSQKYKNITSYREQLNFLLFKIESVNKKLTFRNLIKKFVRSDNASESNTLKVLGSYGTDVKYEGMYLYLLGFPDINLLDGRLSISNEIKKIAKSLKTLKAKSNLPKFQVRLKQIEEEIDRKEDAIKNFNLTDSYSNIIEKLNTNKVLIKELNSKKSNIELKISLSEKSRSELEKRQSKVDPNSVRQLYEEAKVLLPEVQKKFEEVLRFHNIMIENKTNYIDEHINKLKKQLIKISQEIKPYVEDQARILTSLNNKGTFDDLIIIREKINDLYSQKGKTLNEIETIESLNDRMGKLTQELEQKNQLFESILADFQTDIQEIFNKYFKAYTNELHNESLYILYNESLRKFEFDNIKGNVGDGYKKADTIAFDFAFISYYNELGLDFPKFAIHDKLEIVHRNQISTLFQIANSLQGQFIVSVLEDRISFLGPKFIDSNKILELSTNNKFFKIN